MTPEFPPEFTEWLNKRHLLPVHRQLLVLSGDRVWATQCAKNVAAAIAPPTTAQVGFKGVTTNAIEITNKSYSQFLGHEFDLLVYNAFEGIRANALMALSGTVKSTGIMILICPPLDAWPEYHDPQIQQRTSYGYEQTTQTSAFIKWLANNIKSDTGVALLSQDGFTGSKALVKSQEPETILEPYKSEDQQIAVQGIMKVLNGHRNRPLVLSADRGRGKSSSLGIAAGLLAKEARQLSIVITAPRFSAVDKVFQHAKTISPDLTLNGHQRLENKTTSLSFEATDAILEHRPLADILFIDEAAAIPNDVLTQLVKYYSRVVFSTTLHGYEGSGRGFEIRFKKYLEQHRPDWKALHLKAPIRWFEGDVLEQFWFKVMLMDHQQQQTPPALSTLTAEARTQLLSKKHLLAHPTVLKDVFQLLVNAHYQTEPDDLVRLLEGEDTQVFVSYEGNTLVSVALVATEGGVKLSPLLREISQGTRRVRGHLLAQKLAYSQADPTLASITYWRIMRIAVAPDYQRKGLASELLSKIAEHAQQYGVGVLGTSFGVTNYLLRFWQHSDFQVVKLGFKKDPSSGEQNAIMLKPLNQTAQKTVQHLCLEFARELKYHSGRRFSRLNTELLVSLLKGLPPEHELTLSDKTLIDEFIKGSRPSHSCELALFTLVFFTCCGKKDQTYENFSEHLNLLTAVVIQNKDIGDLKLSFDITGKKQLEKRLRDACRAILAAG